VTRCPPDGLFDAPSFNETYLTQGRDPSDLWLVGWRCDDCGRLSFGARQVCGLCGCRRGRLTRLAPNGELESWTTVISRDQSYVVAYCLVGDDEDEQCVRVFGPLEVTDEQHLQRHQEVGIGFTTSLVSGRRCVHHRFVVAAPREGA
jgi:uncharacterized OB-fold protein